MGATLTRSALASCPKMWSPAGSLLPDSEVRRAPVPVLCSSFVAWNLLFNSDSLFHLYDGIMIYIPHRVVGSRKWVEVYQRAYTGSGTKEELHMGRLAGSAVDLGALDLGIQCLSPALGVRFT